jgi:hypothetical protein
MVSASEGDTPGRLAGLEFGLTPKGDPLVLRDVGTQEIYSLNWARQRCSLCQRVNRVFIGDDPACGTIG